MVRVYDMPDGSGLPLAPPTTSRPKSPKPAFDSSPSAKKKSPITPRSSSAAVNNHLSQWRLEHFKDPPPTSSPGRAKSPYSDRAYSDRTQRPKPWNDAHMPTTERERYTGMVVSAQSPTKAGIDRRSRAITPELVLLTEDTEHEDKVRGHYLRVDDAIVGTTRTRDEAERVLAETFAGIDASFGPTDDKRLVCRAFIVQLGRTMGRLREAALRLEKEATDALNVASAERAELESRLRHMTMQAEGYAKQLQGEVERSELDRASQGQFMHNQFERLRQEAASETGQLSSDITRLTSALETSRAETQALWKQASEQSKVLTRDNESLRRQLGQATAELNASRDAHGHDASTLRAELTLAQVEKEAVTQRLRNDLSYMTQLSAETEQNLENAYAALKVEKESTIDALRHELQAQARHYEDEKLILQAVHKEAIELKERTEMELRSTIRTDHAEHTEEKSRMRTQINRLKAVHKEAMEAGPLKARQILFWDTVKSEGNDPELLSWRPADEELPTQENRLSRSPSPSGRSTSPSGRGRSTSPSSSRGRKGRSTPTTVGKEAIRIEETRRPLQLSHPGIAMTPPGEPGYDTSFLQKMESPG